MSRRGTGDAGLPKEVLWVFVIGGEGVSCRLRRHLETSVDDGPYLLGGAGLLLENLTTVLGPRRREPMKA